MDIWTAFEAFKAANREHMRARVALCTAEDRLVEARAAYIAAARERSEHSSPRQVDGESSREAIKNLTQGEGTP